MAEKIYDLTEVAKRIREELKNQFPALTFSVSKDSGSIYIYLMKGNFQAIKDGEENPLQINHYYIDRDDRITDKAKQVLIKAKEISDQYNWNRSDAMTDYFDVNFYLNMGIGKYGKPYEMTSKPTTTSGYVARPSKPTTQFDRGELLKDCAGWQVFKKTLNDGRIVYGVYKKNETKPNKEDWSAIKGEIYVQTGFKWGKFGNFEKWGQIERESFIIETLCKILDKYYKDEAKPQEVTKPEEEIKVGTIFRVASEVGGKKYIIKSVDEYGVFVGTEGQDWTIEYTKKEVLEKFKEGRWIKIGQEELQEAPTQEIPQTTEDEIKVGTLFKVESDVDASIFKIKEFDADKKTFVVGRKDMDWSTEFPMDEVKRLFEQGNWIKVGQEEPQEQAESEEQLVYKVGDVFYKIFDPERKLYYIEGIRNDDVDVYKKDGGFDFRFDVLDVNEEFKKGNFVKVDASSQEQTSNADYLNYKVGDKFKDGDDTEDPPKYIYTITKITPEEVEVSVYYKYERTTDTPPPISKDRWEKELREGITIPYLPSLPLLPPTETSDYPNESYKELPANPKLEYCKIEWAEGLIKYADTFPREFQSFTAMTKYIADNIGELPENGYDKHKVEWKWKFSDDIHVDRIDISKKENNPYEVPNIYASEVLSSLCYYAWEASSPDDAFYKEEDKNAFWIGKEGIELSDEQFNDMLNKLLTYYPSNQRFKYNTPEERLERFKEVYPKFYGIFNMGQEKPAPSKEKIEKAIKGLQYLADKGNENAIKAIKGLKYLLNK